MKKKITISRSQWETMGRKAGWIKSAQTIDIDGLYDKYQMDSTDKPIYVSIYSKERAYGGPEEGGWWYDDYTLEKTKKFLDAEEAELFAERLNEEIGLWTEMAGGNGTSSQGMVDYPDPSGGDPMYDHSDSDIPLGFATGDKTYFATVEDTQGSLQRTERPRYE